MSRIAVQASGLGYCFATQATVIDRVHAACMPCESAVSMRYLSYARVIMTLWACMVVASGIHMAAIRVLAGQFMQHPVTLSRDDHYWHRAVIDPSATTFR
ncbi:hypothetical protein EJ02DRAFT_449229 [Clathrospora elynae]|uniref:Uncharacterized protein n=1 Tax=Clathrospora elynae TaxID=706981 RepID=A0A6A5TAG9_9PLEO|nr:hypothetical protein EJ02DRAFT_449229 [Clathrospora elynae]